MLRELVYFGGDEMFASNSMKAVQGYHLIKPEELFWRPSNLMRIPNADFLERTGSENLGARLWRLPPKARTRLLPPNLMPIPDTTSAEAFERYVGGKCLRAGHGKAWREIKA